MANCGRINVSFNDEDYDIIKFLADECGLPAASFVRMLTLRAMYEDGKQSYVTEREQAKEIRKVEEIADSYYRSLEP